MTKKVVIKNFNDLVEVFPNMTLAHIIDVYKQVQNAIAFYDNQLKTCPQEEKEHVWELLEDSLKADAFLSGYLAKCYCRTCGF